MIDRLRKISYFLAYAVATIPLWHYIHDGRILIFMVTVMLFAYIMVVLSSVQASQTILSSEKSKIAFPRWLPDKPKYQKWWSLSRHTLKWHLLLAIPKMGLALGFMEWSVISGFPTRTYIFHALYYVYGYSSERLPQLVPVFIALFLITTFSIIECNLISSFIFFGNQFQSIKKKAMFILVSRLLLVFSFLGLVFLTRVESGVYQEYGANVCRSYRLYIQRGETNSDNPYELSCYSRRIKETLYLVFITPLDQGVLLSSNIMRPSKQVIYNPWNWSENQLFVARQVVAGLIGLLLYAGATWVILWFAEDEPEQTLN